RGGVREVGARGMGGAPPAFLDEHRNSGPGGSAGGAPARKLGLALVPLDRGQELVEQPDIIARIVLNLLAQGLERPVIGHFIDRTRVAPPYLVGIDAELSRDGIDQPLAHEGGLIPTACALAA